ncbi:hypothetical protein [Flavobacterium lindanitolerans]|jgi:hypothetical protein|uniref:hypothetical protein n=1 Tax=Flavobacterium lindanitolerans TaxID=428988 RepID=UPI0023F3B151|nr:hypothetical protein [Flavobacterium lindanitolerans]
MSYEYFLVRAFQYNQKLTKSSNQEFLNLIEAENGNKHSWLPKFEKQLDDVKKRLDKAIVIFISKSKNNEQIRNLRHLQNEVYNITSYRDITKVVDYGLDITQSFKK